MATKPELVQINKRLAADNEALRAENSKLRTDIEVLRQQHRNVTEVASVVNAMRSPTVRAAAMAQAREEALRSGRSVKVQTL